jgi:dTDP-D-glucose 4,6-dehydratase
MIAARVGVKFEDHVEIVNERLGKDAAYLLDSAKARTTLGWADQVSLEAGIDDTIAWVRENLDALSALNADYVHKP